MGSTLSYKDGRYNVIHLEDTDEENEGVPDC